MDEIGKALAKWLEEHRAEITRQKELTRGRWVTTFKTTVGCLIVESVDNRVVAIAAQICHDDPVMMIHELNKWSN